MGLYFIPLNRLHSPSSDPPFKATRLNKPLHERHLIQADSEEKTRKISKRLFTQTSSPVQITVSGRISRHQVCRGASAAIRYCLYSASRRASPRATDHTPPLSNCSTSRAWDIRRATRPFPSMKG